MLDLRHGRRLRQDVRQVPSPPRRVLSLSPSLRPGIVQHPLDPSPEPVRRLGPRGPDRAQDAHDVIRDEIADRLLADRRIGQASERTGPDKRGLRPAPAGLLILDIALGHRLEGQPVLPGLLDLLDPALLDRVDTLPDQLTRRAGQLARCGQGHVPRRPKAHLPALTGHRTVKPERPGAGLALHGNPEIPAVAMRPILQALDLPDGHLTGRETAHENPPPDLI